MSTRIRTVRHLAVVATLLGAVLLAGCGSDDSDGAAATTTTTEAAAATTTTTAPDDEAPADTVEVTLEDYKFTGLPDSVPAGTKLTITNASEKELHEMVVMRIPDEEERPIDELAQLPEEELGTIFAGEPAMVLLAPPGGEQITAVGDGTITEPGRYAVVCFIPTGIDPDVYLNAPATPEGPPELPADAGPPHFMQGMYAEVLVT